MDGLRRPSTDFCHNHDWRVDVPASTEITPFFTGPKRWLRPRNQNPKCRRISRNWHGADPLRTSNRGSCRYPTQCTRQQTRPGIGLIGQTTAGGPAILANLGGAYIDSQDIHLRPLAEQALQRSIAIAPSYPAYANLGNLYIHERKFNEAATATEKALSINEKDVYVYNQLLAARFCWIFLVCLIIQALGLSRQPE
jgi:hypothetical protein